MIMRLLGGLLFLTGALIMAYNLVADHLRARFRSVRSAPSGGRRCCLPARHWRESETMNFRHAVIEKNAFILLVADRARGRDRRHRRDRAAVHDRDDRRACAGVRPYSPLELRGRDIYVREGCYLCHSQQIRTLRDEVERYGHYSLAAESMYDHPFQWGSKRIGPDLARVGGKYSNDWHYAHLKDPQALVPESLMPRYAFLAETPLDRRHRRPHAHSAPCRRALHRR